MNLGLLLACNSVNHVLQPQYCPQGGSLGISRPSCGHAG